MIQDKRVRQCVSCRTLIPRSELIRITYSVTEKCFSINNSPPVNGRSAYICKDQKCYQIALKGKKLEKALKRAIPSDILEGLSQVFRF